MTKKPAFSSAIEVLVIMVVIAFGYMLVIPNFLSSVSKDKNILSNPSQVTSSYSKINQERILIQATSSLVAQNGGTLKGLCSDNQCFIDKYASVLSVMKKTNEATIVLINGTLVSISNTDKNCNSNVCAKIKIDVNGFKKPNKLGVDIFEANITTTAITSFK